MLLNTIYNIITVDETNIPRLKIKALTDFRQYFK